MTNVTTSTRQDCSACGEPVTVTPVSTRFGAVYGHSDPERDYDCAWPQEQTRRDAAQAEMIEAHEAEEAAEHEAEKQRHAEAEKAAEAAAALQAEQDAQRAAEAAEEAQRAAEARQVKVAEVRALLDAHPSAWRVHRAFPNAGNDERGNWEVPCYVDPKNTVLIDSDDALEPDCSGGRDVQQFNDDGWPTGTEWVRCRCERTVTARLGKPDLAEFMALEQDTAEQQGWIIPGLLAPGERVIVTGGEGYGKSTLGRQVALQVACGVHPFTLEPMPAGRVLYVDVENSLRHVYAKFADMGRMPEQRSMLSVYMPETMNLDDPAQLAELRSQATGADLIVIGPMYKLVDGDLAEEGVAQGLIKALDALCDTGAALWIEAHQPHASNGQGRTWRPYGSSIFKRWPEFGWHLAKDGKLGAWKNREPDRAWPEALERGGEWPWTVTGTKAQEPWEAAGMSKSTYYRRQKAGTL